MRAPDMTDRDTPICDRCGKGMTGTEGLEYGGIWYSLLLCDPCFEFKEYGPSSADVRQMRADNWRNILYEK